jgi:hypothetical protein
LEIGPGQRRQEGLFAVEGFGSLEEERIGERGLGRNADEQVEVIGHHAIGDDFHATELSQREEQIDQALFGEVIEQELPPDGARNAVVDRPHLLDSSPSHGKNVVPLTVSSQLH